MATTVKLALGWTPDTIHGPILVALSKGFFEEETIDLNIINPLDDNYAKTPAKRVLTGEADIAVCPSESVVAYAQRDSRSGTPASDTLTAFFALLDRDGSTIYCNAASSISRPRDLAGKIYGSYNARYEDAIIQAMVTRDGGLAPMKISRMIPKLSLFDRVNTSAASKDSIDATWIFTSWEGLKARQAGLNGFEITLDSIGIAYGYSPVLATKTNSDLSDDTLKAFVRALVRGYHYINEHLEDSVAVLQRDWCPGESHTFLLDSMRSVISFWKQSSYQPAAPTSHGQMDHEKWQAFVSFMSEEGILDRESMRKTRIENLFTNKYF